MPEAEQVQPKATGDRRTALAYERTLIASDRTLLAWTRTAVSLITFGFSIPKFFRYLQQSEHVRPLRSSGPVTLGIALIAIGTLSLAAGMVQHTLLKRRIAAMLERGPVRVWSPSMVTAVFILVFGVYAFVHILQGG